MKSRLSFLAITLAIVSLPALAGIFGSADSKEVATGFTFFGEPDIVGDIAFSPDERFLAVKSKNFGETGGTDVWDMQRKRLALHLPTGGDFGWATSQIQFSPDGHLLAICHPRDKSNNSVHIYDAHSGALIKALGEAVTKQWRGHCDGIAFTSNSAVLLLINGVGAAEDGDEVVLFDTSTWQIGGGFRTSPRFEAIPPVAPNTKETFKQIEIAERIQVNRDRSSISFTPSRLAISPDGTYLALEGMTVESGTFGRLSLPSAHQAIAIVDLANRSFVRSISLPDDEAVNAIDWSKDGKYLAVAEDKAIQIFEANTGTELLTQKTEQSHSKVRYSPDGKYLIEILYKRVEIWDGEHLRLLQSLSGFEPICIAVSPGGRYLALGGGEPSLVGAFPLLDIMVHANGRKGRVALFHLK